MIGVFFDGRTYGRSQYAHIIPVNKLSEDTAGKAYQVIKKRIIQL